MKPNISLLAVIFLLPLSTIAQNWQWAKQVGSNIVQSYDYARVITDGTNSYLIGRYSGSIYLQTDTLNSNGTNDLFVIKYDANGNELWAKGFGGNGNNPQTYESVYGTYDSINNCIYLSGGFFGTMALDTVALLSSNSGFSNIFLAKMELNGNFIWGKSFTNYMVNDYAYVYQYPNGNILLAGEVGDSTYFDSFPVTPGGFFARFDTHGTCLWAAHKYSTLNYSMPLIAFMGDDILFGGGFNSQLYIDTLLITSFSSLNDGFLAKFDSIGTVQWINVYGYAGSDGLSSVAVDNISSSIYICVSFYDSITVDNTTFLNNGQDMLLAKLNGIGGLIWAKQSNSINGYTASYSIVVNGDESFYIAGNFNGITNFDNYSISTSNISDMFLARYNSYGDCLGVRHFGYATANSVVTDNSGYPICAGSFQNTVNIGNNTFTSNGYVDVYLAKCDIFTGIGEGGRMTNNELIIYANPNQGKCNITVPEDFINEQNLTLSIFDHSGKLIQQKVLEMAGDKIKLNLEAEAKGIYNVTLSNQEKSYSGKIVFQ